MSEVALLQLIGLSIVGTGIAILLFIPARFIRVIGFVMIVLGLFSLVALAVPQMASLPRAEEKIDIATIKGNSDLAVVDRGASEARAAASDWRVCSWIVRNVESARSPSIARISSAVAPTTGSAATA